MLNKIIVMGRLTRDVELRYTQNQTPVASFTIACDRDLGEKQTDFLDCVAWKKTAEFVNNYFRKGSMAIVSGRLQIREWEKDGNKRKAAEIVADSVYFGESKREAAPERMPNVIIRDKPVFIDVADDGELPF